MIYIDFLWKPSAQKKKKKKTQQLCSLTLDGIYNYECFAIKK